MPFEFIPCFAPCFGCRLCLDCIGFRPSHIDRNLVGFCRLFRCHDLLILREPQVPFRAAAIERCPDAGEKFAALCAVIVLPSFDHLPTNLCRKGRVVLFPRLAYGAAVYIDRIIHCVEFLRLIVITRRRNHRRSRMRRF